MSFITLFLILKAHLRNVFANIFGKTPIPYKWLIQLTNDCNSRCGNCDIWKINKVNPELKELELKEFEYEKLFQTSGRDLLWLALSGGEISLYQNFPRFIAALRKFCPNLRMITFTTNGIETEKLVSIVRDLKTLNTDFFVVVSLDGDEEIHDLNRGVKGNFKMAHETKKAISELGVHCYFGTTLGQTNSSLWSKGMPEEMKSVSLLHSNGIFHKDVKIIDQEIIKGLRGILSFYKVKSLSEFGEYLYLRLGLLFLKANRKKLPVQCDALSSSLHIVPDGKVQPCMYLPALGNIKEQSLEQILSSAAAKKQRENISQGNCPKCWMNCYAPHSIIQHPVQTASALVRSYFA